MTREDVRKVFGEATDQQISDLLNINSNDIGKAKGDFETLKSERDKAQQELQKAKDTIKNTSTKFEDKTAEEWKAEFDKLTGEYSNTKTETALKLALLDAGANPADMDYLIFKAKANGEIKLGEDGKLNKQEELVSSLKTSCQAQFLNSSQKKVKENTINNNNDGGTLTKADILKKPYNERIELYNQDPKAFNEIMNE